MNTASEILVIILSVFLAVFLLLGIILSIYLIKLTRDIRAVTKSAERTVNHIESAVSGVAKITSPLFVAEIIGRYIKKFTKKRKGE
ncbi:hypothetical protein EPN95_00410 [Patescibacteria group bacterium]|nr:MAG: hypothetical protein EPN95_00410 [Patescibacteria group bacterium]